MSNRKHLLSYLALVIFAVGVIALGATTAYGLRLKVQRAAEGQTHRPISGQACSSCHTSKHKAPLTGACQNCHVTSTWKSVSYRHDRAYLNSRAHSSAPCGNCHPQGRPIRNVTCATCHKTYAHRASPNCAQCHTTKNWSASHTLPKRHPKLSGSHAKATCPDCHSIHQKRVEWYCGDCHKQRHNEIVITAAHKGKKCINCHKQRGESDNLNKVAFKASSCSSCHGVPHRTFTNCTQCHSPNSWEAPRYAHTTWPLRGAHTKLSCTKCHAKQQWASSKGRACASCHAIEHPGLTDCARCHTQSSFKPSTFTHEAKYPLRGAHRSLACSKCHPGNRWAAAKGVACTSCHGVKHGGLKACGSCHSTTSFKPSTFRHSSAWPLTGAHTKVACAKCHPSGNWTKSKGTTCVACHGVKHGGQNRCDRCHATSSWRPIKHVAHTDKYPLIGQHRYVDCASCHKKLDFSSTPTRCVSCHANVSHGMPNCEFCHTPVSWSKVSSHGG